METLANQGMQIDLRRSKYSEYKSQTVVIIYCDMADTVTPFRNGPTRSPSESLKIYPMILVSNSVTTITSWALKLGGTLCTPYLRPHVPGFLPHKCPISCRQRWNEMSTWPCGRPSSREKRAATMTHCRGQT